MKSKFLAFFTLMLVLSGCSPVATLSSEQPTPVIEATSVPSYQPVEVNQVKAEVGVGSPIPGQVTVTGTLPDTCAQIELVQQKQVGSNFGITISIIPSNAEGCMQDPLPFEIVIPLNITNLPAGFYSVEVNGSRADFEVDTTNTTSSQPTADSVITKDDVQVDRVNMEIGVGSPVPVHAIATLSLSNSCAQLGEVRLHRDGQTFYVRLIADVSERPDCRVDSIPFRLEIPLNIVNLPEGPYEVNVNGVTASFDRRAEPAGNTNLGDFESKLQSALMQRDADAIQSLMGERFIMAYWRSEGESIPFEQAVSQLLNDHIGENPGLLEFREFQDIPGFDPHSFVGPDAELAKAIYVIGWGVDYQGQALLFISRRPDGSLSWQGVLVTPRGFTPPAMGENCSKPVAVPVVNGQASYNGISFNIDSSLNVGLTARICAATPVSDQQMINEAHPPYTEFFFPTFSRGNVDYQPQIRVYEATGNMEHYIYPLNMLSDLQASLEQRPQPATWFEYAPLHARDKYLDFGNGAGVRALVQYMQDVFFYTNNGLTYEFNGLTQDGRHFVLVRYPVSVPFLMELDEFSLPPNNINPSAIAISTWPDSYEQQGQVVESYNNEALKRFKQMSESDVVPNLTLLDQLVQSIQVD